MGGGRGGKEGGAPDCEEILREGKELAHARLFKEGLVAVHRQKHTVELARGGAGMGVESQLPRSAARLTTRMLPLPCPHGIPQEKKGRLCGHSQGDRNAHTRGRDPREVGQEVTMIRMRIVRSKVLDLIVVMAPFRIGLFR